ncbi:MAG: hypothetical protein LDL51_05045 [Chloroflexi bacterium]|nr:hypothetical protein [Chloroflexota bacterium]
MKNKKWLNYVLGFLLTLLVLIMVAGAGFQAGMRQNASSLKTYVSLSRLPRDPSHGIQRNAQDGFHSHDGDSPSTKSRDNLGLGNFPGRKDNLNFVRRNFVPNFFKPLLWFGWLLTLGLLIWIVFLVIRKSGWRLSFSKATPAPAPAAESTPEAKTE